MSKPKKIILCPNPYRDKDMTVAARSKEILDQEGFETVVCLPFQKEGYGAELGVPIQQLDREIKRADLLIAFGGDGTILHLAKTLAMNRETYRRYPPEQNWLSDLIQTLLVDEMFRRRCRRRNCRKWSQKT